MSPTAGAVLLEEIAPRLKAVVPYIKTVGCEDSEELYADGLAMAAYMLFDQTRSHVTEIIVHRDP